MWLRLASLSHNGKHQSSLISFNCTSNEQKNSNIYVKCDIWSILTAGETNNNFIDFMICSDTGSLVQSYISCSQSKCQRVTSGKEMLVSGYFTIKHLIAIIHFFHVCLANLQRSVILSLVWMCDRNSCTTGILQSKDQVNNTRHQDTLHLQQPSMLTAFQKITLLFA